MRFSITILVLLLLAPVPYATAQTPQDLAETESALANRNTVLQHFQELEAAGAADTSDPQLHNAYIEAAIALGYHDLAAEQYERMLEENSGDTTILRALGEAWMRTGTYGRAKAFEALKKALVLDANDNEARTLLAHLCHREGLYEQAAQHYDEVLSRDPDHVRATIGKAVLMARSGDIVAASSLLDKIGGAGQIHDVETRIMLRKALFTFERRNGWFADNAANHAAYARLLYRAGRITDGLLAARRAVTHDASDYNTWNFMGAMSIQIGNLENAEQAYGKSLEANPDQPVIETSRRQIINELTLRRQDKAP